MRRLSPSLLLLAGLVSACADPEPFVDQGITPTVDKPLQFRTDNTFNICYSEKTPAAQVELLAREHCASVGLEPLLIKATRWQCRGTSPHQSNYQCVDPQMRDTDGTYVDPLNPRAVGE